MIADALRHRYLGAARFGAVLVPILVAALLAAAGTSITTATSALVLVLVVVAFSAIGDRVAGLLAAVSSAVWFDFFLTDPVHRFTISDPDDIEVFVLLVLVGAAVGEIALWGVRQGERAARRRGYLDGVLEAADHAATEGASPEEAARRVCERVSDVLGADSCRYVPDAVPARSAVFLLRDGGVERNGVPVDVDRDGLPTDSEVVLPVPGGRSHLRVTAASRVARPNREQRRVAVLLADQLGTGARGGAARDEGLTPPPALTPPG